MTDTPATPIAVGTQVVTRTAVAGPGGAARPRGAVGVVMAAPAGGADRYAVRFPDGAVVNVPAAALAIRKHGYRGDLAMAAVQPHDLERFIVYRCVVGSRAFGLDDEGSDTDRRGVYLPPADLHWSLYGVPEQLENDATQECYWELGKFLALALKANPNILEALLTPLVEFATPLMQELLAMRGAFMSQQIYQTYNGYVLSQFKKLEADLRTKGAAKPKHIMHLIRLLLAGIAALRHGEVLVDVGEHRAALLAIKRGAMPWDEVNAWRLALHREFDAAYAATPLPERPDYERANAFLLRARRSRV